MKGTLTLGFLFVLFFLQGQSSSNFCIVDSSQLIIPGMNEVNFVKESPDRGIIGLGYKTPGYKAVLFKLDENRQLLWSKVLDTAVESIIYAAAVDEDGFIYFAYRHSLVKIDNFGNFVWGRRIEYEPFYPGGLVKIKITQNQEVRVLHSGINVNVNGEARYCTAIHQFNQWGDLLWEKTYYNFHGTDMTTENEEGAFYTIGAISGVIGSPAGQNTIVMKLSGNGQVLLSRRIRYEGAGLEYEDRPIVRNEQGGVFVGIKGAVEGAGQYESIIVSLTDQLGVRWAKQWGMQPNVNASRNIIGLKKSPLGGYIAYVDERANRRVFLYNFDAQGRTSWTSSYYHQWIHNDTEFEVFSDGKLAYSGGWANKGFVVLADERGYAGECGRETAEGIFSDLAVTTSPYEINAFDLGFYIEQFAVNLVDLELATEPLCVNEYTDLALQLLSATQCGNEVSMEVEICNSGIADFTETSAIAFYDKDPSREGAQLVTAVPLSEEIPVDSCKKLQLQFTAASIPERLFALVNNEENRGEPINLEEESALFLQKECSYLDNLDSIEMEEAEIFSLGPNITLCKGEELRLSAGDQFVRNNWLVTPNTTCEDCQEINLIPRSNINVFFTGETAGGCTIRDTVFVKIVEEKMTEELRTICPGESTLVFGREVTQAGLYEQSFQTAGGCDSIHQIEVKIGEPMELSFTAQSGCEGQNEGKITIDQLDGGAPIAVFWPDLKSSAMEVDNLSPGTYALQLTDGSGCRLDTLIGLPPSRENPQIRFAEAGPIRIDEGASVLLEATVAGGSGGYMLQWSPGKGLSCVDCLSPMAQPDQSTTYVLTATDENGCSDQDSILVEVEKNREVFAPNVFSPNGDGINDYFYVMTGAPTARIKTFRVFDRWGNLVVEKRDLPPNDEQLGWNGRYGDRELPSGTYVYFVEVDFGDEVKKVMGEISLIR